MKIKSLMFVALAALLSSISRLPVYSGWLVFVAMIPLLHYFEVCEHKARDLFFAAAVYSAFYIPLLLYWISLVTVGGLIGIFFLYTWYFFLAFYAIAQIWKHLPGWKYIGFVSIMISMEYIQNYGELRFPWLNLGYSLADYSLLIQSADLGGVVGLSILILCVNVLLYCWIKQGALLKSVVYPITIIVVFGFWIGYGVYRVKTLEIEKHDARIYVSQPSIEQDEKWDAEYLRQILEINQQLTVSAAADSATLVIWPEAAMPTYVMHYPSHKYMLQNLANTLSVDIFTGFPHYEAAPTEHVNNELYYNSAALFCPFKEVSDLYHKVVLVPVAERTPWLGHFPLLWKIQVGQANWEYGTEIRYYKSNGFRFSPSICYEIAFPDLNHQMAIAKDAEKGHLSKSDYLVNITNDAWFGTSYGPWLHGVHTRFRAIENRIQIFRSANTGISMIVDPLGKVLAQTELFECTNITAPLYISREIPLIRRIYSYPMLIVLFSILLFITATLRNRIDLKKQSANVTQQNGG